MDLYTAKGKIYKIMELEIVTERFQKQEFVIQIVNTTDKGSFSDFIKFQCINNKIQYLQPAEVGDFCIIQFVISGRKYKKEGKEDMFFTNLDVTDIKIVNKAKDLKEGIPDPKDFNDYSDLLPGIDSIKTPSHNNSDIGTSNDDLPF